MPCRGTMACQHDHVWPPWVVGSTKFSGVFPGRFGESGAPFGREFHAFSPPARNRSCGPDRWNPGQDRPDVERRWSTGTRSTHRDSRYGNWRKQCAIAGRVRAAPFFFWIWHGDSEGPRWATEKCLNGVPGRSSVPIRSTDRSRIFARPVRHFVRRRLHDVGALTVWSNGQSPGRSHVTEGGSSERVGPSWPLALPSDRDVRPGRSKDVEGQFP